jgi:hypothetical protein
MYRPNVPAPTEHGVDDGDDQEHDHALSAKAPAPPINPGPGPRQVAPAPGKAEPAAAAPKGEPPAGKKGAEAAPKGEPSLGKKGAGAAPKGEPPAGKKGAEAAPKGEPSLGKKGALAGAKPHAREQVEGLKQKGDAGAAKPQAKAVASPAGAERPAPGGAKPAAHPRAPKTAGKGHLAGRAGAKGVAKRGDAGQRPRGKWAPPGTRHPAGLAIDVGALKKRDGTWISVARHFDGHIGERTCGDGARAPDQPEARELRAIVCESSDLGIFTYVLTPNYNVAHADHYHMEIKPGVRWFLVH